MQDSDLYLRPFHETEIDTLRRIERAAHRRYRGMEGFEHVVNAPAIQPDRFRAGMTVVAQFRGNIAGYVIVQPLDGMLYVANLMVDNGLSGNGIGGALLQWAETHAAEIGVTATCLTTFRKPRWNAPWYQKMGYVDIPADKIGSGLQVILDRHATFLDMGTRITMWKPRHAM